MKSSFALNTSQVRLKLKPHVVALLLATQAALGLASAQAQTVASPTAAPGARPIVAQGRGLSDLVHIAAPNAAGVSHNQYDKFNVSIFDMTLNNSSSNPQFVSGGRAANIILNEVTSVHGTKLGGLLEVSGQKADVIIVNPNGIDCQNCSFGNVGRATLSTGLTQFNADGSIQGFDVEKGIIKVDYFWLKADGLEQLDLLARGIIVNGDIKAGRINAIAGANKVSYSDVTDVQSFAGSGDSPKFAIDMGFMGGMYAKQIFMVATEKGLGVHSKGRLRAHDGVLSLKADGDLYLADSHGEGGLHLVSHGGNIDIDGNVTSGQEIYIKAERDTTLRAWKKLTSNADMDITSGRDVVVRGNAHGGKNVNITAGRDIIVGTAPQKPDTEIVANPTNTEHINDVFAPLAEQEVPSITAPADEAPLRGSTIAERVRNTQSQFIENARARFSEKAADKFGEESSGV